MEDRDFVVPWAQHKIVHALHARCEVLSESHTDDGTVLSVRAPKRIIEDISQALASGAELLPSDPN